MNRARRLGLNIVRPFKPWTHEEKEGLRKLTGLLGVNTIAKRLGRSPYAIKNQLSQMNLTAQLTDGYTIRQLQLLLGVPNRSIQMWLTTRALHMDLDKERITEASVREFVKNNMHEYSFRRVMSPGSSLCSAPSVPRDGVPNSRWATQRDELLTVIQHLRETQ